MIAIPEKPLYLINKLNASGYKAYIVGGCVRDSILGLEPKDWDICTSATPEETATVFDEFDKIDNGIKHGTVGVIFNGEGLRSRRLDPRESIQTTVIPIMCALKRI